MMIKSKILNLRGLAHKNVFLIPVALAGHRALLIFMEGSNLADIAS